ncbi:hypothetical protein ACHQM5_013784 [Ranunculus cassubicifolius]
MIPDNNFYSMGSSQPSSSTSVSQPSSTWTLAEDKQFEQALVIFDEDTPNRFERIASCVPGKSVLEIEKHYQDLVDDINAIEAGFIQLPNYTDDLLDHRDTNSSQIAFGSKKGSDGGAGGGGERRKGTPWTEEEHKLFLIGLQKYGKGDWRSISRNAVVSRTPTQVASHAQKYFNRVNSDKKEKKRSSIHDITVDEATLLQVNNQNNIVSVGGSSQQGVDSYSNQGGPGYQSYGYPMQR